MKRGFFKKQSNQNPSSMLSEQLLTPAHLEKWPVARLFGYARVSTEEQRLDMQKAALQAAGVLPRDLFEDKLSAVSAHRPAFNLMWKQIQPGDHLVVYSFSRLSRDLKTLLTIVDDMEKQHIGLHSTSESHVDPFTTSGRMFLSMLGLMDENERRRVRDRTRDGMAELKRQGMMLGRPVLVTPEKAKEMRKLRKTLAVSQIAKRFNVSKSAVYAATK